MEASWILHGFKSGDIYTVIASDKIIKWEWNLERFFNYNLWDPSPPPPITHMKAELRTFVTASGASYQEALARLFGFWNPDVSPDDHDSATPRQLPSGSIGLPPVTNIDSVAPQRPAENG